MKLRFVLLLLTSGCAVTPRAALRHEATVKLSSCLLFPGVVSQCLEDNRQWCKSQGLESSCGSDGFWPKR